ncbi:helix-turn-helix domain-containing protein [Gottfriedia sp. S16(2024)]|uniref:helix-turn-helix domain-containing protein n=1 Tax=Gottfriedia sp. S16(2024) TaxID=3162883 RepID=UPI003D19BE72
MVKNTTEILDSIIGAQEASEIWGLAPAYIKDLCAKGEIKAKKIGKTWVIDKNQENPRKLK